MTVLELTTAEVNAARTAIFARWPDAGTWMRCTRCTSAWCPVNTEGLDAKQRRALRTLAVVELQP